MKEILKDVRVVDFTWAGAGPYSTKVLSDFGAEVIKLESTTRPDSVRLGGPFADGEPGLNRSGYFASRNTGKKSLSIDLKHPEGKRVVRELISKADVVCNNFGPGAMGRLGFSYEEVKAIRPDIIYLAMPMYGENGPRAGMLGVGMTISAVTGLMLHTSYADNQPLGPGTHYPDHAANPYHAAFAVMSALHRRKRCGLGMKIELAQVESTINSIGPLFVNYALSEKEPSITGNRSTYFSPHNIFPCYPEDSWVAIAVKSNEQWKSLVEVMELHELANDISLDTLEGRKSKEHEIENKIAQWTQNRSPEEAVSIIREAGINASVVANARHLLEKDADLQRRDYWQQIDHPEMGVTRFPSQPYRFDGDRIQMSRPPLLGEHTEEVLNKVLGYSKETIDNLRRNGSLK